MAGARSARREITTLLRALPKSIRKQLVPIPAKAKSIAAALKPTHPTFLESLQDHIRRHYHIQIQASDWNADDLPNHLKMRVDIQGTNEQSVAAGRDLQQLTQRLEQHDTPVELDAWKKAAQQWEREGITTWDFGDLPERIEVTQAGGVPLYGWPGLYRDEGGVSLRLYKVAPKPKPRSREGFLGLCALALRDELAWLRRELQELAQFKTRYQGSSLELRTQAFEHLERYLFHREQILPLRQEDFDAVLVQAKQRLRGLAPRFISLVDSLLEARREILLSGRSYRGLDADLERLLPDDFLARVPFHRLSHLLRYLKAVEVRAERAATDPRKDTQKAELIEGVPESVGKARRGDQFAPSERPNRGIALELEEYRVSVFAQEWAPPTRSPQAARQEDRADSSNPVIRALIFDLCQAARVSRNFGQ